MIPEIADHISSCKLLGVTFQNDLKWDSHIVEMIGKANRKLFMLRKLKQTGFTNEELVSVYKSYIRPVLEYASAVWHSGVTVYQTRQIEQFKRGFVTLF